MNRLDEIAARVEAAEGGLRRGALSGSWEGSYARDIPFLLSEVARLRDVMEAAWRGVDSLARYRHPEDGPFPYGAVSDIAGILRHSLDQTPASPPIPPTKERSEAIENLAASRKRAEAILVDPERVRLLSYESTDVEPMTAEEFKEKYRIGTEELEANE